MHGTESIKLETNLDGQTEGASNPAVGREVLYCVNAWLLHKWPAPVTGKPCHTLTAECLQY